MRIAIVLAACGGAAPATPQPPVRAPVRLAIAHGGDVRIVEIDDRGAREVRNVPTGATSIDTLVWDAVSPAVMLDVPLQYMPQPPDFEPPPPPSPRAYEVGRIAERGYAPLPKLPPATWTFEPNDAQPIRPEWGLVAGGDGSLWQEHCEWGFSADGGEHCGTPLYARLQPAPVVVNTAGPKESAAMYELAEIAPPTDVRVAIDDQRLACTSASGTVTYPPASDPDTMFAGMSEPIWLSARPAMFAAGRNAVGFATTTRTIVFEGCTESTRYSDVVAGPRGIVVVYGAGAVVVLRGGHVIGRFGGADRVVFAPER